MSACEDCGRAEAEAAGEIAVVVRATGLSRTTIRAGRAELRAGVSLEDVVQVRRAGGGRPRLEDLAAKESGATRQGWSEGSERMR